MLGLQEGATENSAAAKDLLEDLVRRGVKPERRRLFVIDGSKALRAAINAVFGGASVGAPGVVRMLALAHARHGRLPWARLFDPAIRLAEHGFTVSPRLSKLLARRGSDRFDATARAYFFDAAGKPRPPGERLANPAFAATLRAIAANGPAAFYQGDIADAIVRAVAGAPACPRREQNCLLREQSR